MPRPSVHNPVTTAYYVDQCDDIEQLRAFAQRVLAAFYASHKQTTHTFERDDCAACTTAYDEMDSAYACDDWKAWQKDVTAGFGGI
jgi:hypothetical protein